MEHRYLKIVAPGYFNEHNNSDELADLIVDRFEFEELSVELLKIVREAIILLTQIIYFEENTKDDQLAFLITVDRYYDEWKL